MKTGEVESRVLVALRKHLLAPDVVADAVETYRQERQRLQNEHRKKRNDMTRDVATIDRKLKMLLDVLLEGRGDPRTIKQQMLDLAHFIRRSCARASIGGDEAVGLA